MPDSTLSRRSAALHARLAKYPSGNHKIIPRIFSFNHRLYFTAGIGDESHGLFGFIKRSGEQDEHDSHE